MTDTSAARRYAIRGVSVRRVDLYEVVLPLVFPFETSVGVLHQKRAVLISVSDGSETGWGEVAAWEDPWYSYETVGTSLHVLSRYVIPFALSRDRVVAPIGSSWAGVRGYPMAKAALEAALLDLEFRSAGISLARGLGGTADRIAVGISLGIEATVDRLLERIEVALEEGYRRIKVKIRPGWDVAVVDAIRSAFGWPFSLSVDANGAYQPSDVAIFRELDRYDLTMVEQPLAFDDLDEHARLQAMLATPICLDESVETRQDTIRALKQGSCRIVNIKPGRVGGLSEAVLVHDACQEHGVAVFCGGMLETGIGRAANVALASLPNFTIPGDISASRRYFDRDVITEPFVLLEDGTIAVPQCPGLGVEVDRKVLETYTVSHQTFTS